MASRNADQQRRHRQRLMIFHFLIRYDSRGLIPDYLVEDHKARGLVHVQGWVTPTQADVIRRIMAELVGHDFPSFMKRRIIVFLFS
jgi:hypothetical protein